MNHQEKTITLARIAEAFGWTFGSYSNPDNPDTTFYFLEDPKLDDGGRLEFVSLADAANHIHGLILDMDLEDLMNALRIPDDFRYDVNSLFVVWQYSQVIRDADEIGYDTSDEISAMAKQEINDWLLVALEEIMDNE